MACISGDDIVLRPCCTSANLSAHGPMNPQVEGCRVEGVALCNRRVSRSADVEVRLAGRRSAWSRNPFDPPIGSRYCPGLPAGRLRRALARTTSATTSGAERCPPPRNLHRIGYRGIAALQVNLDGARPRYGSIQAFALDWITGETVRRNHRQRCRIFYAVSIFTWIKS